MAGHAVGTVFAEVDLDFTPYTRAQKLLLKDATTAPLNIEKAYKDMGIRSAKEFDLMRVKISNAYDRITKDAKTSAQDIIAAEKAKAYQLNKINEQQLRQAKGELGRITAEHKSATQKILEHWKAIAVGVAVVGLYKIASQLKEITKESTLLAARYETLGVVMENVGRNVGVGSYEMEKYAKALQATGISAIESRQNLVRMAQANIDLTQSTELARIAQDAAVIGMMNSSEAYNNMIYGIQTGQIRVLRTIGLNVNFENSYKKLASQLGKTTDELSDLEKMQARVNTVMDAGKNIAGTYEASMTTASKQIYSMQRYVEDLKVAFGEAFQPALIEIVQAATRAIKDMRKVVEDPQFTESLANIAGGFASIVVQLGKLAKYTNLRSILGTAQEAAKLSSAGMLDMQEFMSKGFLERQKMVDDLMKKMSGPSKEMLDLMIKIKEAEDAIAKRQASWLPDLGGYVAAKQKQLDQYKQELAYLTQVRDEIIQNTAEQKTYAEAQKLGLDAVAKEKYKQRLADEKAEKERIEEAKRRAEAEKAMWKEMAKNAKTAHEADLEAIASASEFAAKAELKRIEDAEKANEKILKEHEHFLERVQDATADTFYDIFTGQIDSFKDFMGEMKDLFLRTLSEMMAAALAKPIIVPIVASVSGAMGLGSLTGAAGGSGGLGITGIPGLGQLGGFIPGVSSFLGSSPFGSVGGMTSADGFTMAGMNAGASWGSIFAVSALSSIGYSTLGKILGLSQGGYSGIGSGVGGGLGYAFGGPLGAAAGAALGGLVGSLFGGKAHRPHVGIGAGVGWTGSEFTGIPGMVTANSEWASGTGTQYATGKLRGGNIAEAVEYMNSTVQDVIDAYTTQINALISSGDIETSVLEGLSFDFVSTYHGNNVEEFVENALGGLSDAIEEHAGKVVAAISPQLISGIDISSVSGLLSADSPIFEFYDRLQELSKLDTFDTEQLTEFLETFQGVSDGIALVNEAWNSMDYEMRVAAGTISEYQQQLDALNIKYDNYYNTLEALGFAEEKLAGVRAYQAGAIEKLTAASKTALGADARSIIAAHSTADPVQEAIAWRDAQIAAWMQSAYELGMTADESIALTNDIYKAFELMLKDIVDDIEESAEELRQARIDEALGNLVAAIENEIAGYEQAQAALEQAFTDAENAYVSALTEEIAIKNDAIQAAESIIDAYDSLISSISDYRSDLLSTNSALAPDVQYQQAKLQLEQAVQGLYSGDAETIQKSLEDIPGLSEKFLDASEDANADFRLYRADFAKVMTILNTSEDIGQVQKTVAEQTLEAALRDAEALEEMLDEVEGAAEEIKSLADLQREYNDAQLALDNSIYPDLIAADQAKINLLSGISENTQTIADALKGYEDAQDPMQQAQDLLDMYNEMYGTNASLSDVGAYAHELAIGAATATSDIMQAVLEIASLLHPEMSDDELGSYYKTHSFAEGGTVSGPASGYSIPTTFHGVEHITPDSQMSAVVDELKEVKDVLKLILNTSGDINKYTQKAQATLKKWERDEGSLYVTAA